MRAAVLHAPGDLRIEELAVPAPGPGEVLLEVRAATTCGTDRKTYRRGHPALGPLPSRLGHELAGTVAAVGEGVGHVAAGDVVFCGNSAPCGRCWACAADRPTLCEDLTFLFGGFGEMVLVPARIARVNLHRIPDGVPVELAPIAEPLGCVVRAVEIAAVDAGDEVAILGAGSLGLMICALVADAGARPIVLDPHAERRALATRFGAAATVAATRGDRDVDALRAETGDERGAEQVFEAVGRPEAWELAVGMARPGGTVNLFGGCPVDTTFRVPTHRVHYEEVRLQGTFHHTPAHLARALEHLARLAVPWADLLGGPIGLDDLEAALRDGTGSAKDLVLPSAG